MPLTIKQLAKITGASLRTVNYWGSEEDPVCPSPEFQSRLDEILEGCDDAVRARFAAKLAELRGAMRPDQGFEALVRLLENGARQHGAGPVGSALTSVLREAWSQRFAVDKGLSLVLIAGFAGSGKTEFARYLATVTRWFLVDKDESFRSATEALLVAYHGDSNDRESPLYLERVRPHEYKLLMQAIAVQLAHGSSVIASAPFLREITDVAWLSEVRELADRHRATVHIVWLSCDAPSMYAYLVRRNAPRDTWKLSHWTEYLASIDLGMRPLEPHVVVDNDGGTLLSLVDKALDLCKVIAP